MSCLETYGCTHYEGIDRSSSKDKCVLKSGEVDVMDAKTTQESKGCGIIGINFKILLNRYKIYLVDLFY